jgi:DNA helicase-2/ATP-dependent DNA helicase PcrA
VDEGSLGEPGETGETGELGELGELNGSGEVAGFEGLNRAQRSAVEHGLAEGAGAGRNPRPGPLLIIAGAGTGKTNTLAHRVARLLLAGADPRRLLLLTFTRRAAAEMTRRAQRIAVKVTGDAGRRSAELGRIRWAGTFHSVANRLLRLHAESVGLDPSFTVLDRSDAADLMDLLRSDLGLAAGTARFPRKGTCLAIYSHTVNAQWELAKTLERAFPWCVDAAEPLRKLFAAYVEAKQARHLLDYDDLLLYWAFLMEEPALAARVRERFDHVLVDEYQDTNALQASVLRGLAPDGRGLTVVGDDAQSIYSFRAASVRNILDFPKSFDPPAEVVKLEENYRSTGPILQACNAVMEGASERFTKTLRSRRRSDERPALVAAEDEVAQVDYVVERVLAHREAGVPLQRQAVLMRTAHHSDALEVELARRNIPFVKYGGLKFLEAAHVKDVLCLLRWAENPRDELAAHRVLQLLPGVGPATARSAYGSHAQSDFDFSGLAGFVPPAAAASDWSSLCALLLELRGAKSAWPAELRAVRRWYQPHLERLHDAPQVRAGDLEQLEQLAATIPSRERFLSELTLDPPTASTDEAGDPLLDEDFLILSTIHSAKGQEWDVVFVLNVVDGCIPSDMATGRPEEIEEERRLLYVAMTRARDHLHLVQPLRFYVRQQHRHGDAHVFAPRSRFLPDEILDRFERVAFGEPQADERTPQDGRADIARRLRGMWTTP